MANGGERMSLRSIISKIFPHDQQDESESDQRQDALRMPVLQLTGKHLSPGCDIVPGGHGQFGRCATNPIPVNGLVGEFVYLNRLRSASGVVYMYHRLGSTISDVTGNCLDMYELVSVDAREWCVLFFDMYHERRSAISPAGMALLSWSEMNKEFKMLVKMPMLGVNGLVSSFPQGLAAVMANSSELAQQSPKIALAFAKSIDRIISSKPQAAWERPSQ